MISLEELLGPQFMAKVVRGPLADDCWIWTGAISDDGYGRYWTSTGGRQRVVRPQRFVYEKAHGVILTSTEQLLHQCDVSVCVHALSLDGVLSHLRIGTSAVNRFERSRRRERFPGLPQAHGLQAAQRPADIARAIRDDVLENGFDAERIRALANGLHPDHPRLF